MLNTLAWRPSSTAERIAWAIARGKIEEAAGEGADAIGPLIELLRGRRDDLWVQAAEALERLGDARAIPPLVAASRTGDPILRRACAGALGQLGDARCADPLIAALRDQDADVRARAAEALGRMQAPLAVTPLAARLQDPDAGVRARAAQALGKIGDARATDALLAALQYHDHATQARSAEALAKIAAPAIDTATYTADAHETRKQAATALVKIGCAAVSRGDSNVETWAAKALAAIKGVNRGTSWAWAKSNDAPRESGLIWIFESLLETSARIASTDSLLMVTRLKDRTFLELSFGACGSTHSTRRGLDCSSLRQLAGQELIRRGIRAQGGRAR